MRSLDGNLALSADAEIGLWPPGDQQFLAVFLSLNLIVNRMDRDPSHEPSGVIDCAASPAGTEGLSPASTTKSVPPPPPPPRGVPPPPPPPGSPGPDPPQFGAMPPSGPPLVAQPANKRWDSAAWLKRIVVLLAVCMLLVAGFVAGQLWSGDTQVVSPLPSASGASQSTAEARPVPSGGTEPGTKAEDAFLEAESGPLCQETSSEPVVNVARAVSPSIVLIETEVRQGSGVVWDAENGYIVTNNHVVEQSSSVEIQFPDGQRVAGIVIGGDSSRDIAVIGVDPDEVNVLIQADFAPTSTVEVGQLAVVIGGPFGLDQSVTAGVVSAINRVLLGGGSDPENASPVEMIQTDAPINPGNSGGALVDRHCRVIGINTQIQTTSLAGGNIGVGFAIPSDTIVLIARRIVSGESLDVGFLGIQGETPTDGSPGALVTSVVDGSPADDSGIKAGDLIIAVNGKEISSMADLAAEIKLFRPGEAVDILLLRDGTRLTVRAILIAA